MHMTVDTVHQNLVCAYLYIFERIFVLAPCYSEDCLKRTLIYNDSSSLGNLWVVCCGLFCGVVFFVFSFFLQSNTESGLR